MSIVAIKQRVGLRVERCSQCRRTVVLAGEMISGGNALICEMCAAAGLPGVRGHDVPTFAVEWAEAAGEVLDAQVCAREAQAWDVEAEMAERSKQPDVAVLARQRAVWMHEAYRAFLAGEREL